MRKVLFLILFISVLASAVDYDTTAVWLFNVNLQKDGDIRHYATIGGESPMFDQQLSLLFTQMENENIDKDSITTWFSYQVIITADGAIDTMFHIIQDVGIDLMVTTDTLSESWFDLETWRDIYDGLEPYYVPVE